MDADSQYGNDTIAKIHLLDVPYHIDKQYEYFIPQHLRGKIIPGCFVIVPFGSGNVKQPALVIDTAAEGDLGLDKMKPVLTVYNLADNVILNGEMLGLCAFMKEYTFCTIGDAVKTILPSFVFVKYNEIYSIADPLPGSFRTSVAQDALVIYNFIKGLNSVSLSRIKAEYGNKAEKTVNKLLEAGLIYCDLEVSGGNIKTDMLVSLDQTNAAEYGGLKIGAKQKEILEYLYENGGTSYSVLNEKLTVTKQALKKLEEKKLIVLEPFDVYRDPYKDLNISPVDENILSAEQCEVTERIMELYRTGEPKAVLLHGVTGSGKTRVVKAVTDEVLKNGRKVITLVPEISLTPQAVAIFRSYYGERVAVIHSLLSPGERYDAWRKIRNGEIDICIGTRSAVFAPFNGDEIGLIVIDEEQEHTYKSEMNPKYHARDIARFRCAEHKALMLLSSATPSPESYFKAKNNNYSLIELNNRYGNAEIPVSVITDLKTDVQSGNLSPIGAVLREEIEKNLINGEQTILFLNRRGYNNFICCPMCGNVIMCPHCSVSLTFHNNNERYNLESFLQCHYCGHVQEKPKVCPECGSEHIAFLGYGTQKVEEELQTIFPKSRIMRMDADTTSVKFSFDTMLERFRNHEADILLGTQMVTKGHDFPKVTLVGVLSADLSMYVSDYRANERTFTLITQVIGRAGRSDIKGRAVIQTYNPDHPVLLMAADQNYKEFYENEILFRKTFLFPPYCDIIVFMLSSESENEALTASAAFSMRLNQLKQTIYKDIGLISYGPFEALVYKLNEKYRMRIIIKCRMNNKTRGLIKALLNEFNVTLYKKISISVDVNPTSNI